MIPFIPSDVMERAREHVRYAKVAYDASTHGPSLNLRSMYASQAAYHAGMASAEMIAGMCSNRL